MLNRLKIWLGLTPNEVVFEKSDTPLPSLKAPAKKAPAKKAPAKKAPAKKAGSKGNKPL